MTLSDIAGSKPSIFVKSLRSRKYNCKILQQISYACVAQQRVEILKSMLPRFAKRFVLEVTNTFSKNLASTETRAQKSITIHITKTRNFRKLSCQTASDYSPNRFLVISRKRLLLVQVQTASVVLDVILSAPSICSGKFTRTTWPSNIERLASSTLVHSRELFLKQLDYFWKRHVISKQVKATSSCRSE